MKDKDRYEKNLDQNKKRETTYRRNNYIEAMKKVTETLQRFGKFQTKYRNGTKCIEYRKIQGDDSITPEMIKEDSSF